jgi:hypothetical protein
MYTVTFYTTNMKKHNFPYIKSLFTQTKFFIITMSNIYIDRNLVCLKKIRAVYSSKMGWCK